MTAYLQNLQTDDIRSLAPLHVRLREYVSAMPKHRQLRPFGLEQLCEELDAEPTEVERALRRCGFVRHVRAFGKHLRWEFWLHWSSPHQF